MKFKLEVDLDDLWDECGETYSEVIKAELQHEFKLAVRREMKRNDDFEKKIKWLVSEMSKRMEIELTEVLRGSV